MGTLATSVNVKNPQTSNHSKSTLTPLIALPVTFDPGLPALIGSANWRYRSCKLIINSARLLAEESDVIDFASSL
jgi:hypothetical protein